MNPIRRLVGSLLRRFFERRARGRSLADLADALERSGVEQAEALAAAADTAENREIANHVVGIERWGQRRLRVGLGEAFEADVYRVHRLADDASMEELRTAFADARRATAALARDLHVAGADPARTVPHNDLGDLSLGGWLAYLDGHAGRELGRLRS